MLLGKRKLVLLSVCQKHSVTVVAPYSGQQGQYMPMFLFLGRPWQAGSP